MTGTTLFLIVVVGVVLLLIWNSRFTLPFLRNHFVKDKFGETSLVRVLLSLEEDDFKNLMELYRKEFGPGAARYARKTHSKWKTGKVQPSRQTFERLLLHLPKVMPFDLKCEVLRHFMAEFAPKDDHELTVGMNDWDEKLTPLVRHIVDKAYTTQLPVEVERKLQWLGDGDMKAAQDLLRASQAEEGRIMISTLREEFENIKQLLSKEHLNPKINHVLKFPYGNIRLYIKRR